LPKEKSGINNNWSAQKTVMIGSPGCGKSTFWSFGDKTLYVQTEAGLNHLSVLKVVVSSWADWESVYGSLLQAKIKNELDYDTIVIDSCDRLIDFANEEAVARGKEKYKTSEINVVGDIPNGAGWSWVTDLIENMMSKLEKLGCHIVLIGHLDRKEIKQPNNTSVHLQTISIGGKTGRAIMSWADHILNIEAKMVGNTMQRVVRAIPTVTVDAKSRGGVIKDGWVWSQVDSENYAKFRGAFK
jgi:KaiC/GvpD/RAD55 family RecA-like ATPase